MDEVELSQAIRAEVSALREAGKHPTEIRLSQDSWNLIRRQLSFGSYGPRSRVLFEGLPCVLTIGLRTDAGFRVRHISLGD